MKLAICDDDKRRTDPYFISAGQFPETTYH